MTKILVDLSAATEGFGIAEFSVTEARSRQMDRQTDNGKTICPRSFDTGA